MSLLYNAGLWASLPPNGPDPARGVLENPDAPIRDILLPQLSPSGSPSSNSARLPLITLPARRAPPRRIRSFGDLGSADNLPDMEAASAAISLKDEDEQGEASAPFLSPSLHHSASSPALMRGRGAGGAGALPVAPTTPLAAAAAAAAAASVFADVNAHAVAAAAAFEGNSDDDDDSEEALVPGGGGSSAALAAAALSSATTTDYSSADMADGGASGAWTSEDDTMEVDDNDNSIGRNAAAAVAAAAATPRRRPPLPPLPPTTAAAAAASSSRRALRVGTGHAAGSRTAGGPSAAAGQKKKNAYSPLSSSARLPPRRALPPAAKPSLIDRVLLTEWADRAAAGLFRYDVAGLPTRLLAPDGRGGGFVAQFNEGRLTKKRPTEFAKDAVVQRFDDAKFNFLKAAQKEVLFALTRDGAPGTPATWFPEGAPCGPDPSLLLINVSPIEYGHVLLVPRVASRLPQLVDVESAALALRFAAEADNPYLRLCYNSLGAFGTVNHLHFQAYFLATPFAVEVAATAPLPPLPPREVGNGNNGSSARFGVAPSSPLTAPRVSTTVGYPARALVFEATRGDLDGLAAALGDACSRLAASNVPHNVFIVDCGQRAFLFPNVFGTNKANGAVPEDLLETQVDPACFELAGHMVFKRRSDFYELSEGDAYNLVWRLLAAATPKPEEFARIVRLALAI